MLSVLQVIDSTEPPAFQDKLILKPLYFQGFFDKVKIQLKITLNFW